MIKNIIKRCLRTKGGKRLILSALKLYALDTNTLVDDNVVSLIDKLLSKNFDIESELSFLNREFLDGNER